MNDTHGDATDRPIYFNNKATPDTTVFVPPLELVPPWRGEGALLQSDDDDEDFEEQENLNLDRDNYTYLFAGELLWDEL